MNRKNRNIIFIMCASCVLNLVGSSFGSRQNDEELFGETRIVWADEVGEDKCMLKFKIDIQIICCLHYVFCFSDKAG